MVNNTGKVSALLVRVGCGGMNGNFYGQKLTRATGLISNHVNR